MPKNQLTIRVFGLGYNTFDLSGKTPQEALVEIVTFMQNSYHGEIEDFSKFIGQPSKFNTAVTDKYYLEMQATLSETERMKTMAKYQLQPYGLLLLPNGACVGSYDAVNLSVFNYDRSMAIYIECPSEHHYVGFSLNPYRYVNDNSHSSESIRHQQQPLEISAIALGMTINPEVNWQSLGVCLKSFKYFADCDFSVIPNKPVQQPKQIFDPLIEMIKRVRSERTSLDNPKVLLPSNPLSRDDTRMLLGSKPDATKKKVRFTAQ